jgi:hypothetical protein
MKDVIELLEQNLEAMKDALRIIPMDEVPENLLDAIQATEAVLEFILKGYTGV